MALAPPDEGKEREEFVFQSNELGWARFSKFHFRFWGPTPAEFETIETYINMLAVTIAQTS